MTQHMLTLESMTVQEVRDYLAGRQSIILPMGSVEQHGDHLPLSTDTLIAEGLAGRVSRRTGILVGPSIRLTFSGGQLPGTINVNPNVVGLLLADVLRSLVAQGFRNLFLLLCHGGSENARALDNSLKFLLRDDPLFTTAMLVLAPVWKFAQGWKDAVADGDWHAGWLETSMVMELSPQLVRMERCRLDDADLVDTMRRHPDNYQEALKPMDHPCVVPRMRQRPAMRVGVMGSPTQASPERGQAIVADAVDRYSTFFTRLESERWPEYRPVAWTPEPILLAD